MASGEVLPFSWDKVLIDCPIQSRSVLTPHTHHQEKWTHLFTFVHAHMYTNTHVYMYVIIIIRIKNTKFRMGVMTGIEGGKGCGKKNGSISV